MPVDFCGAVLHNNNNVLKRPELIRHLDSAYLLQNFLVASVASILVIRFYLHLTGYPQIGGGGLHIAHMLWGGVFMLAAIFMLLLYINKNAYKIAAIVGGIGFGTFIDELGKFITQDNNYFFAPTASLIYVIFVAMYLAIYFLQKRENFPPSVYLINALEVMKEAPLHDLDMLEKEQAHRYLSKCDQKDPMVKAFSHLLSQLEAIHSKEPGIIQKVNAKIAQWYKDLLSKHFFKNLLIFIFVLQAIATIFYSILLTEVFAQSILQQKILFDLPALSLTEIGDVISSTVAGLFVVAGVIALKKSRLAAYRMFKIALLITLLLTEFFIFYDSQFNALYGFTLNLLLFITLNILINQEENLHKASITI